MKKIAIDMGSSTTKIYMPGCGVVLTEATCVAVEEYAEKGEKKFAVKAFGDKARALAGRAAQGTKIVSPVWEGDIVHERLAALLLEYFLEKVELPPRKARFAELMLTVPCGAKADIRGKYVRLATECGFEAVNVTFTPFAAVAGHNAVIGESTPVFSLDMGHTVTNVAAFSRDGMISGLTLNVGGWNIDARIMDELAENNNFKVGALTAERVKNTVGSLLRDDNKLIVADGIAVSSGAPDCLAVNSGMLLPIIKAHIDKILEYVRSVMSKLPPEACSAVMRGGIYLSGGLMKMDGLSEYIGKELDIPVIMPEEPLFAAVIGGGAILADEDLCDSLAVD